MACNKTKYVGRDVVLEYVIGCGDSLPLPNQWKRLGSMRTKEFTLEWETTDATADDSVNSLRENLATFLSLGISGDGTLKNAGAGGENLKEMTKHVANPVATGGQPTAWFRMTFPDLTFTGFMLVSNMSRSAPHDDVATYSFEANATSSDFGLLVEDTPDPDAPDVTSVTVLPDTAALVVGGTQQLTVTVVPSGAPQGVVWQSSNTDVATVTQNGLVTAIGAGSANITVASTTDGTKSDVSAVTVTAP